MPPLSGGRKTRRTDRLRRAHAVLLHWRGDEFVFTNYRTAVSVVGRPATARLLDLFGSWLSPDQAAAALPEFSARQVCAAVRRLQRSTLLVAEGSAEARLDQQLHQRWSPWLPFGAFHFATKDVRFADPATLRALVVRPADMDSPQPPLTKSYRRAPRVPLPAPQPAVSEFPTVLLARQTHREFSRVPVDLHALSSLLYYSFAVMGSISTIRFGPLIHKTSPSGGARHPVEAYVVAVKVDGLAPGIYHYDTRRHRLNEIHRGNMRRRSIAYCVGQEHVKGASALVVMTAVIPREMWKYRTARAYRVVLLDAGHVCQTLCLTATWLGLGAFTTAALKDSLIERDLGIDGVSEVALYVAGLGLPKVGCPGGSR